MSFTATSGACVLRTPDRREHLLTCRLTVGGDNPYRAFAGAVDGELDGGWQWATLIGGRVRLGVEEHDYWVRVEDARSTSAWVQYIGYIGTRRLFVTG